MKRGVREVVIAAVIAVAGGVIWLVWPSHADSVDLVGTFTLHGKTSHDGRGQCVGQGGYADIHEGAPITVYDDTHTVIGTGQLEHGDDHGWTPADDTQRSNTCWFSFTVTVPRRIAYQLEISHRGPAPITYTDVTAGPVELALGG